MWKAGLTDYEEFARRLLDGHPVLDALAFGKPVLSSSKGATAEVGAAATCLVDPFDIAAIAGGLHTVTLDAKARARLSAAGPARVRAFTWAACAEGSVAAIWRAIAHHEGV